MALDKRDREHAHREETDFKRIARRNKLPDLSMGMSVDFPVAIQFGATVVRVGTAIFGPRR